MTTSDKSITKYEYASLTMSALALVASLTTPILTYKWFDTNAKEFEQRGRFVVVGLRGTFEQTLTRKPQRTKNQEWVYTVKNVGLRPAANVQLIVVRSSQSQKWPSIKFRPTLVSVSRRDGQAQIQTLQTPIAPDAELEITVNGDSESVLYLYTAQGDSLTLSPFSSDTAYVPARIITHGLGR